MEEREIGIFSASCGILSEHLKNIKEEGSSHIEVGSRTSYLEHSWEILD
jgi:hypothetical protein